ncbi:DUF2218 domain-containing protein [uncultured Roseobacter sp.]|uniref:DUF2218 domain-containing protein n=1 Tax=uncultured Roseobacter sp. TaxID=114847 RepID=UPI0026382E97|nr:DUF2218 domain-containing protein [uncultured Roseobacter sp.]
MPTARSTFETKKAPRYLQQLCKHFAHKVDVRYGPDTGQVDFPLAQADLTAHSDRLEFEVRAESRDGLERTKRILEDHITRFAFRENPKTLEWSD